MKRRWTAEEANSWYQHFPWLRGSNFLPSNVVNRLDMYQSYLCEEHLAITDKELSVSEELGFNTVRLWLDFDCYYLEKDKYLDILEKYISLCAKHHHFVMIVITHEEDLPYGERFVQERRLGEQVKRFTHFNRDYEDYLAHYSERKHYLEYEEIRPLFLEMVDKVVKKYSKDDRIIVWNIYNEPGITIGDRSIPIVQLLANLVRSNDPIQPLCSDIWRNINDDGSFQSDAEKIGFELSDIISYHCYGNLASFRRRLKILKQHYQRPIFVTEWLQRVNHNTVEEIYPLMAEEKVACYCWGFVNGDTFTDEPWNDIWLQYEKDKNVDYDFTKWQHNLYRRNLLPYNPKEIEIIKRVNNLIDAENKRKTK